jgi:hypothetical protein
MNYIEIIVITFLLGITHLIAEKIGNNREIGYGKTVLLSLLLTPFISFFIAKSSPRIDHNKTSL